MKRKNIAIPIFVTCISLFLFIISTSIAPGASEIGNEYEQYEPVANVLTPKIAIDAVSNVDPGETIEISAATEVDSGKGGSPFYYWWASAGTLIEKPLFPDFSHIQFKAPNVPCNILIRVEVGDRLGYVASDSFTLVVGDYSSGNASQYSPASNPDCTYTVNPTDWQFIHHAAYLLTAERTSDYKSTGHFRIQPVIDDQLWDFSGRVQVLIDNAAVTLYEDPDLRMVHGNAFGYNQGSGGFEFWFDADFSSHKSIVLHHEEDGPYGTWDTPWMFKSDCPTEPPVEGDPDLKIDAYEVKPSYAAADDAVQLRIRVRNFGDGSSSPCKIGYYLADNGQLTLLYEDYIGSLNPGMTSIREPYVNLPSDLSDGEYEIKFFVDDGNVVDESNENNNERFATLIIGTGASQADLIVDSFSPSANQFEIIPGQTFSLSASVKNIGGSGTSTASRIAYIISEDPFFDTADTILGTNYFGFLLPGESSETFQRTFAAPSHLTPGATYYLLLYADYQDFVVEEDQEPGNNIAATSFVASYSKEMTVFNPNAESAWGHDRNHEITWASNLGGTVKIELYKSLSSILTIAEATANDGVHQWTVPSDLLVVPDEEKQYKIVITSNANPAVSAESARFRITYSDSVTVLTPTPGEEWGYDTSRYVSWDGTFNGTVEIQLLKGGQLHESIASVETTSVRDCGYAWLVPSDIPQGTDYQIQVVKIGDDQTRGVSQGTFSIVTIDPEDIPIAVPDAETTAIEAPVSIRPLSNDNPPNGETLYIDAVTQPQNGSVAIDSGFQSVTYTPNPGFTGTDTFTYTAETFTQGPASAEVVVTVVDPSNKSWITLAESAMNIATDAAGNVYASDSQAIEKYTATGELEWRNVIEGSYGAYTNTSIVVDEAGAAYIVGTCSPAITPLRFFEGDAVVQTIDTETHGSEMFIAKYDASGHFVWAQASHGLFDSTGQSIAIDRGTRHLYVSGTLSEQITLGEGAYASTLKTDSYNIFLSKFTLDGELTWAKRITGGGGEIFSMAVDATGDLVAVGLFEEQAVFPGPLSIELTGPANDDDFFIAKFNPNGEARWAEKATGPATTLGRNLCVDDAGNIYVAGSFDKSITFVGDNAELMTLGQTDARNLDTNGFLAKYSPDGGFQWATEVSSSNIDYANAVGLGASGNPVLSGHISTGAVFGDETAGTTLKLMSGQSGFIATYSPDGEFISVATPAGEGSGAFQDMEINTFGHICLSGNFDGAVQLATEDNRFEFSEPGSFVAKLMGLVSLDKDGDGVMNDLDAFPDDPSEWEDVDADGMGDNADPDDDDDGMTDSFEISNGFDPLNPADATEDPDNDGYSNLEEYFLGTDPLNPPAPSSRWTWGRQSVGTGETGYAVATDRNGNIFATGAIGGETTFGGIVYTPDGWEKIIAKYDDDGNCLWVNGMKLAGNSKAHAIATDNAGNVYVAGSFQYSAYFGATKLTSIAQSTDVFIAKYNGGTGALMWVRQNGSDQKEYANGLASDGVNVYMTGYFSKYSQFGAKNVASHGSYDAYVAKFDGNGNCLWVQTGGGIDSDYGKGVAVDGTGNIFVAGNYKSSATFGGATITSKGSSDTFLAKYTPNGVLQYLKSAGGVGIDYGYGVAADSVGNAYLVGRITDTVSFGAFNVSSNGSGGFVAKYLANGNVTWVKALSCSVSGKYPFAHSAAMDGDQNLYVRGYFDGAMTLGDETIFPTEPGNAFIVAYDAAGNFQWVDNTTTTSSTYHVSQSIAVSDAGDLYVVGDFNKNLTLGADTLMPTGASTSHFFLGKIGDEPAEESGLLVTPHLSEIGGQGGSASLQVQTTGSGTVNWTADINANASWLSIESGSSGVNGGMITVSCQANAGEQRTAALTVSSPDAFNQSVTVEIRQEAALDTDGDGVSDLEDAFPNDPAEWQDSDNDGTGDNADPDDDNDGLSDDYETAHGLDSLNPDDALLDNDNDGYTNLEESQCGGSDPNDPTSVPSCGITQEIILTEGWNLISLFVEPSDASPAAIFSPIADSLAQVKSASESYDPNLPGYLNDLSEIQVGYGYWVKVEAVSLLQIPGAPVDIAALTIPLNAGWNLVGYPLMEEMDIEEALSGIMESLNQAKSMSESYDPNLPAYLNDLSILEPNMGYWLDMSADVFLQYPSAP